MKKNCANHYNGNSPLSFEIEEGRVPSKKNRICQRLRVSTCIKLSKLFYAEYDDFKEYFIAQKKEILYNCNSVVQYLFLILNQDQYLLVQDEDSEFLLPVTRDGAPDWAYMEKYIKAIEKVVIADVVNFKDDMIEKTKDIIKPSDRLNKNTAKSINK